MIAIYRVTAVLLSLVIPALAWADRTCETASRTTGERSTAPSYDGAHMKLEPPAVQADRMPVARPFEVACKNRRKVWIPACPAPIQTAPLEPAPQDTKSAFVLDFSRGVEF